MNKKHDSLILIVSILVAVFTIFVAVFFFKIIENKNEHTSKVLMTLDERMEDKKNTETLKSKFAELGSFEQKINDYFVDPDRIDLFVDYLEKLGVDNKTELAVENVATLPKKKNIISVKVSIVGEFTNVMRVVSLLENVSYNIILNQVFVNKDKKIDISQEGGVNKETINSFWQADVSFDVLTLPKEEKK